MNITVYLGANPGNDPALKTAVRELGTWIGQSGNALVYGGSKAGLMGELAESVLDAGGEVTGVEPQFFIDAFIAFPGGTGTLEEISEIMSKICLGHLHAPCIIYNLNGYYDSLRDLLQHMIDLDLSSEEKQQGIYFVKDLPEIIAVLEGN